jgi:hypothetical protein
MRQQLEFGDEHGRDAIEGCAFIFANGFECSEGVEGFRWKYDGAAVGSCGHISENTSKATTRSQLMLMIG